MSIRAVVPRKQACRDVDEVLTYDLREAGPDVALGFVDALEQCYAAIAEHPEIGSPRYGHELDLPNLRHWRVGQFPHSAFYVASDDRIDVWRVLDCRREIPVWLQEPE